MNSNNKKLIERVEVLGPDEKTVDLIIEEIKKSDVLKLIVGIEAIPVMDDGDIVVDYISLGTKKIIFQIKRR